MRQAELLRRGKSGVASDYSALGIYDDWLLPTVLPQAAGDNVQGALGQLARVSGIRDWLVNRPQFDVHTRPSGTADRLLDGTRSIQLFG